MDKKRISSYDVVIHALKVGKLNELPYDEYLDIVKEIHNTFKTTHIFDNYYFIFDIHRIKPYDSFIVLNKGKYKNFSVKDTDEARKLFKEYNIDTNISNVIRSYYNLGKPIIRKDEPKKLNSTYKKEIIDIPSKPKKYIDPLLNMNATEFYNHILVKKR